MKSQLSPEKKTYYTYMVRCGDGSLYTGYTTDLKKRVAAHTSGRGAKYTRSRRPVVLAYYETHATKSEALKREAAIKKLPKKKKEDLAAAFAARPGQEAPHPQNS